MNCLSVIDHFGGLVLKELIYEQMLIWKYWDSSFCKLHANNMLYNVRDLSTYTLWIHSDTMIKFIVKNAQKEHVILCAIW